MFKEYSESELVHINRMNDALAECKTMEERVNINKAFAVLLYKRLTNQDKLKQDTLQRYAMFTTYIDDLREVINIDGDILKKALIENDTIINNKTWEEIYTGGLLYPEYPVSCIKYKPTIISFILNVMKFEIESN